MSVFTNEPLAAHPAFGRNVEVLRSYGVRFVPDTHDLALLSAQPAGVPFPWDELRQVAEELHTSLKQAPRGDPT